MNLTKTANIADKINRKLGQAVSWLALLMAILMFLNVICRYIFNSNLIWQQELVGFMHAILFLAAAGYTLQEDKHVRVDVLYQSLSVRNKAIVNLVGTLIFLLPVCFAISYLSYDFILSSWKIREASAEYNGMQGVYLLKSCIWVFTFSLILQGLSNIAKSIITLKGE